MDQKTGVVLRSSVPQKSRGSKVKNSLKFPFQHGVVAGFIKTYSLTVKSINFLAGFVHWIRLVFIFPVCRSFIAVKSIAQMIKRHGIRQRKIINGGQLNKIFFIGKDNLTLGGHVPFSIE